MSVVKTIPNPDKIKSRIELDDIITLLEQSEKEIGKPVCIVKRQNLSLGVSYDMVTLEEAREHIGKWHGSETYLKLWDAQYFSELRKNYK